MVEKRVGNWVIRLRELDHTFTMEIETSKYGTPFVATRQYLKRGKFESYDEAKRFYDSLNTLRELFLFGLSCAGKMAYSDFVMYGKKLTDYKDDDMLNLMRSSGNPCIADHHSGNPRPYQPPTIAPTPRRRPLKCPRCGCEFPEVPPPSRRAGLAPGYWAVCPKCGHKGWSIHLRQRTRLAVLPVHRAEFREFVEKEVGLKWLTYVQLSLSERESIEEEWKRKRQ